MVLAGNALPAQAHTVLSFVDVAAKGAQHAPYRAPTISNYRMTIVQGSVQAPRPGWPRRAPHRDWHLRPEVLTVRPRHSPDIYSACPMLARSRASSFSAMHIHGGRRLPDIIHAATPPPGRRDGLPPPWQNGAGPCRSGQQGTRSRRVLLRHANWSPIAGKRGQVERDVLAMDVSPGNDWSQVRVWYDPIHGLGTTHWPVSGFIYARKVQPVHGLAASRWTSDPIGAIIAAFSGK
jgi:hypothetical protein